LKESDIFDQYLEGERFHFWQEITNTQIFWFFTISRWQC